MADESPLFFRYHFVLADDRRIILEVNLNPETLEYVPSDSQKIPDWASFNYLPCEQCDAQSEGKEYCPVAANISEVVEAFKDVISYDVADVIVETNDRTYFKEKVSVQQAVSSLLGIIMVSSGCKDLDKLRPIVRFHLPFATIEETIFRITSMYLLAQYIRKKHEIEPDWDMEHLSKIYEEIDKINANLCKRLQTACEKDAGLNAVVILDTFAQTVPFSIEETLADFEHLFSRYLS